MCKTSGLTFVNQAHRAVFHTYNAYNRLKVTDRPPGRLLQTDQVYRG